MYDHTPSKHVHNLACISLIVGPLCCVYVKSCAVFIQVPRYTIVSEQRDKEYLWGQNNVFVP